MISNTRLINTCSTVIKNKFSYAYPQQDFPYRANNILECEFFLLENMDCCLVVFQPYRPLVQYCQVSRETIKLRMNKGSVAIGISKILGH